MFDCSFWKFYTAVAGQQIIVGTAGKLLDLVSSIISTTTTTNSSNNADSKNTTFDDDDDDGYLDGTRRQEAAAQREDAEDRRAGRGRSAAREAGSASASREAQEVRWWPMSADRLLFSFVFFCSEEYNIFFVKVVTTKLSSMVDVL